VRRVLAFVPLVLSALVLAAAVEAADIRRIEAVGTVPIREGERKATGPKEAAIQAALREAVSRVARDFLLDADPDSRSGAGADDPQRAALLPVLGRDMVRYTKSFRILEDRGPRPALFVEDAGAATEYVVIVEVRVDATRVEKRLIERGLLASRGPVAATQELRLEVLGLDEYAAYEQLRALLLGPLGARSVAPLELERGRSVLGVKTELEPAELLHRLLGQAPENMQMAPLAAEPESIRLRVRWTPPPESGAPAAPGNAPGPRSRRR
jgi:hypothetical protein